MPQFRNLPRERIVRKLNPDKPYYIVNKEVDSPASVTVPYGGVPMGVYIRGNRYPVGFARIQTPQFINDVDELLTYHIDMRQVLGDNSVKDMLAEEEVHRRQIPMKLRQFDSGTAAAPFFTIATSCASRDGRRSCRFGTEIPTATCGLNLA
jgi:hypothetical protein